MVPQHQKRHSHFDKFPKCLENSTIGPGKMYPLGLSSQCLMAYFASH
jgi:hypothetical protein